MRALSDHEWTDLGALPMLGNNHAPPGWIEVQRDDEGAVRNGAEAHECDEHAACVVARASGVGIAALYNPETGATVLLDVAEGEDACSLMREDVRAAIDRVVDGPDAPAHWIVMVPTVCRKGGAK